MSTMVLITGIGNIGKSTLREKVCRHLPYVVGVDMDYTSELPAIGEGEVLLVESVHGLEQHPERFDSIVYLLPPPLHSWRWVKRGWAWWRTGIVDLPNPKGIRRPFSIRNIPIICAIVSENILKARTWVSADMAIIREKDLLRRTWIGSPNDAFKFLISKLSE